MTRLFFSFYTFFLLIRRRSIYRSFAYKMRRRSHVARSVALTNFARPAGEQVHTAVQCLVYGIHMALTTMPKAAASAVLAMAVGLAMASLVVAGTHGLATFYTSYTRTYILYRVVDYISLLASVPACHI